MFGDGGFLVLGFGFGFRGGHGDGFVFVVGYPSFVTIYPLAGVAGNWISMIHGWMEWKRRKCSYCELDFGV